MARRASKIAEAAAILGALGALAVALSGCGGAPAKPSAASPNAAAGDAPAARAKGEPGAPRSNSASRKASAPAAAIRATATASPGSESAAAAPQNTPFEFVPPRARPIRGEPRRPIVAPTSLRLADLPSARIPPVPQPSLGTRAAFAAATPTDELKLVIKELGVRSEYMRAIATVQSSAFSMIRLGSWVGWSGGPYGGEGGAHITCSSRDSSILPARWETLAVTEKSAELTVTDGWFDVSACKVAVARRTKVTAAPLFSGSLVYAFRACRAEARPSGASAGSAASAACAEDEELTLLFPRTQNIVASALGGDARREIGSFSRVSLPIRRGGGGSMMAQLPLSEIQAWKRSAGIPAERSPDKPALKLDHRTPEIYFGLEISQSIEDAEPFVIGYIGPEDAPSIAAALGAGRPDSEFPGPGSPRAVSPCSCEANDPLCSCF
jgi:hypothetical protein